MQKKVICRLALLITLVSAGSVVLIRPTTAEAQSHDSLRSTSCPVSMDSVKAYHNVLYFYYQNTAGKDVDGVMFDAAYYDEQQIPHHIDVWGQYNDVVHQGKYKKGALGIKFLRDKGYSGIALWPTKVLFRDGTSWSMRTDGQNCAVVQKGEVQQAGVLPPMTASSILTASVNP